MVILFMISLVTVWIVFRPILKIALLKNVVDRPDARKLQKSPVPVLGGVAVFFGIIVGLGFFKTMVSYVSIFPVLMVMTAMLYVGMVDDIISIKAWKRLSVEFLAALLIIYGNRFYISCFQGLWGIGQLPMTVGIILSVITFAGIVNAINMVDGVDGLCSGFCLYACLMFGLVFFLAFDYSFCALAAVTAGSILPFFMHNVFGRTSKMFFGDGGTMVMGTMISAMVFELLGKKFHERLVEMTSSDSFPLIPFDFSLIAFALAVLAIPIADTLRVMFSRIIRGTSPFEPDNTHLHHYFIRNGYSHFSITCIELSLNLLVLAAMMLSWVLGASVEIQLYVTILTAATADMGSVALLSYSLNHPDSAVARRLRRRASSSNLETKGLWLRMQRIVDRKTENLR